jgi:hypothetical protein
MKRNDPITIPNVANNRIMIRSIRDPSGQRRDPANRYPKKFPPAKADINKSKAVAPSGRRSLARTGIPTIVVKVLKCLSWAFCGEFWSWPTSTTKSPIFSSYFWRRYCFSHPLFIRPHRKDISHEHNPDAPRKSNPYIIAYRLI